MLLQILLSFLTKLELNSPGGRGRLRKDNKKAFRKVFRYFVSILKEWELIESKTIGIDFFKIRAQNSLKNSYNQAKIDRHQKYIDNKVEEYLTELDQAEKEDNKQKQEELKQKLEVKSSKNKNITTCRHS